MKEEKKIHVRYRCFFLIYYFIPHKVTFIKNRIYNTSIHTVWTSVRQARDDGEKRSLNGNLSKVQPVYDSFHEFIDVRYIFFCIWINELRYFGII